MLRTVLLSLVPSWATTKLRFRSLSTRCQRRVVCKRSGLLSPKSAPLICIGRYMATHPWHIVLYRAVMLTECTRRELRKRRQHRVVCRRSPSTLEKFSLVFVKKLNSNFSKIRLPHLHVPYCHLSTSLCRLLFELLAA